MKFKAVRKVPETKSRTRQVGAWLPSTVIGIIFVFLPLVFSSIGWDKFRFPKELIGLSGILVAGVLYVALNGFRIRLRLLSWESLLLASYLFLILHTLLVSGHGHSWFGVLTIGLFVVLLLLLRGLCSA
ncbi:MAG: hypothetical protein JSU96_09600, partial [Acidobacteriota bacterium]